jgi:hypothetical protein
MSSCGFAKASHLQTGKQNASQGQWTCQGVTLQKPASFQQIKVEGTANKCQQFQQARSPRRPATFEQHFKLHNSSTRTGSNSNPEECSIIWTPKLSR